MTTLLSKELDALQEMDVMHPIFLHIDVNSFLQSVVKAQYAEDCILIADIVRLQLLPFLEMVQVQLAENVDLNFFDIYIGPRIFINWKSRIWI